MTKTVRTTYQGRIYDVTTNEAERHAPLCVYCQVRRVRADGKPGRKITTTMIIFEVLKAAEREAA